MKTLNPIIFGKRKSHPKDLHNNSTDVLLTVILWKPLVIENVSVMSFAVEFVKENSFSNYLFDKTQQDIMHIEWKVCRHLWQSLEFSARTQAS
jgi:hypothetical protein